MSEISNVKPKYDLDQRCLEFARKVYAYVNALPKSLPNRENSKQLVRSAGSVGANYIEASESLGKKDFAMRIKISRKEAKESEFWLKLTEPDPERVTLKTELIDEAMQLRKIFGAIVEKSK
jgi:four helix bundle protein